MADDKTDAESQRGKTGKSKPDPVSGSTQKELLSEIKETLIKQSENLGDSLGRDTINVRRHLLEMKNMTAAQLENQKALNQTFGAQLENEEEKLEGESVEGLKEEEKSDDMKTIFEDIRDSLKGQPEALAKEGSKESGKLAQGLMGGMGKMMGGLGIGIGAAGVGAAAVIGAGAYLLNVLDDIDSEKIKENVANLLSISDLVEGDGDSFIGEGSKFFLTMLGLGLGLAAFAIGSAATMGASALSPVVEKFTGKKWTDDVKDNVITLLSISDEVGGAGEMLKDGGAFFLAMAGLGLGLTAFAIGQGAAAVASGLSSGVEMFTKEGDWAEKIKKDVVTLLSISKELGGAKNLMGESGAFFLAMTGLGLGLVAFAIGKAGSGVGDAITLFQGENFAKDIKAEVETLLSISQIEGIGWDTAKFGAVMGGLAAGLVAFSAGKGASGAADMLTWTQGPNFAEDIKKEVATLLTIGDLPGATLEKTKNTTSILVELSKGLAAFGAGTFISALGQAGQAVVQFFSGKEGPVEQALTLANNADRIDQGVDSLHRFKDVLTDFQSLGDITFDMNTEQMAKDLLGATEIFELALEGGEIPKWGFNTEIKGLLNIEGIDRVTEEINLLKSLFAPIQTTGLELVAAGNPALAGVGGPTSIDQSTFAPTSLTTSTSVTNLASIHSAPGSSDTGNSLKIG